MRDAAGDGSPETLPGFDLEALRGAFADPSVQAVRVRHRAGLLDHPRASALEEVDPSFAFACQGPAEGLAARLKSALRSAGLSASRAWEALNAEVSYLVRVFASLAEDPAPSVHLSAAGAPAPSFSPSSRLALVYTLAPGRYGEADEADTALLVRGQPASPGTRRGLTLYLASERLPGPPSAKAAQSGPAAEVLLVSMPFGLVGQPSLALGLLQGGLPPGTARSLYFTIPFARRIGLLTYTWIAELRPFFTAVIGEWLFGSWLAPASRDDVRRYLNEILLPPTARWLTDSSEEPSYLEPVPQGMILDLLRIREAADVFLDECVDEILARRPRIVGLTSVFQQHTASLALARRLKARAPEVAVILGGYNCEGAMGLATVRRFECVDAVVSGEGDVVFPQIVERLRSGASLDGLRGVYTHTSPEAVGRSAAPPNAASPRHLDDLAYPDFDDFFAQYGESGLARVQAPRLALETARGCWWGARQHCTFCGLNGSTMAFRSKTPERALAEIRALSDRHPGLFIDMADNILDMRYFATLLPRLSGAGLGLRMFYEVKANLRKEQVRQLREAGVVAMQPGTESLSDEVLRIMRKGVTALQNLQLLKWCAELGVQPYWNLIWGFPGEPPEEYEHMAALLPLLHHLPPPAGLSRIFLERFSPNFFDSAALGFADVRPAASYGHIYPMAAGDLDDLAYFFDYGYRDERTTAQMTAPYTRPLMRRAFEWRDAHPQSRLIAFDMGDRLLVLDSRPVSSQPLGSVEGLARTLYLACDAIRTIDQLCHAAAAAAGRDVPREEVEELLQPLAASGYLVRQGDAVLALAIPGRLGAAAGPQPSSTRTS